MLLELNDINPNKLDLLRETPLGWASEEGHEGIMRMLLERNNVDPNEPNLFRETPLLAASMNGHEGVVRMLRGWNNANPPRTGETASKTSLVDIAGSC